MSRVTLLFRNTFYFIGLSMALVQAALAAPAELPDFTSLFEELRLSGSGEYQYIVEAQTAPAVLRAGWR